MFLNPLLNLYSANRLGLRTGSVFLGSPACADDFLFLARSAVELQEMICVQEFYANDEHYISDTKTRDFIVNSVLSTEQWNKNGIFNLNGNDIEVVEECTHLGIQRDSTSRSDHTRTVDEPIQSARRCLFSHGRIAWAKYGQSSGFPLNVESLCTALFAVWSRHFDFNQI